MWTYKNIGLTRLLTSSAVYQWEYYACKFGVCYAQQTEASCFNIAAASELWIKFDILRLSTDFARAGNGGGAFTGIEFCGQPNFSDANIYINGVVVETLTGTVYPGYNMSYWMHMKAGAADGLIEIWKDYQPWEEIYTYAGNVNNGAPFNDIYTWTQNPGQFFSNVVISDAAIPLTENADYPGELTGDTRRELYSSQPVMLAILGDTRRKVAGLVSLHGDTRRILPGVVLNADTRREVERTEFLRADTRRTLKIMLTADTRRRVANRVQIAGDTRRRIPRIVETDFTGPPYPSDGITAINLNLQEGTITDTASYGTVIHTLPKDELKGMILDFPYSFICESTSHSGQEMTARCTYDVDRLLYETFTVEEQDEVLASQFINELAALMGKTSNFHGRNFWYKQHIGGKNQTYKGIVSSIFGWSSRIPRMQYNVFIRNDKLIVMQRGSETGVVNLDEMPGNWIASLPTIEREIIRTISPKNIDAVEPDITAGYRPRVFIDGGDDEYNNEQVTYEGLTTPAGEVDSRPSVIYRQNADGSTTTIHYYYQWTGSNYVLKEEWEETRDAEGNFISSTHTYHEILQGGWRNSISVAQDEDGNTIGVGSTGARTRPGDMATSAYSDQVKLARGGRWKGVKNAMPGGTALVDTDFPIDDISALSALRELYWMNQRIKETVTIDLCPPVSYSVPAYQHVIDFTDKVIYGGNVYFLSANNVSFTPTGHRQSLRLVRWF